MLRIPMDGLAELVENEKDWLLKKVSPAKPKGIDRSGILEGVNKFISVNTLFEEWLKDGHFRLEASELGFRLQSARSEREYLLLNLCYATTDDSRKYETPTYLFWCGYKPFGECAEFCDNYLRTYDFSGENRKSSDLILVYDVRRVNRRPHKEAITNFYASLNQLALIRLIADAKYNCFSYPELKYNNETYSALMEKLCCGYPIDATAAEELGLNRIDNFSIGRYKKRDESFYLYCAGGVEMHYAHEKFRDARLTISLKPTARVEAYGLTIRDSIGFSFSFDPDERIAVSLNGVLEKICKPQRDLSGRPVKSLALPLNSDVVKVLLCLFDEAE